MSGSRYQWMEICKLNIEAYCSKAELQPLDSSKIDWGNSWDYSYKESTPASSSSALLNRLFFYFVFIGFMIEFNQEVFGIASMKIHILFINYSVSMYNLLILVIICSKINRQSLKFYSTAYICISLADTRLNRKSKTPSQ